MQRALCSKRVRSGAAQQVGRRGQNGVASPCKCVALITPHVNRDGAEPAAPVQDRQALSLAASVLTAWAISCNSAVALDLDATQATFGMKCAGCHMNGGNVLAAGASLFPDDLKRNGAFEPQALYELIYKGKGKMPGFGKDCAPKGACTFGPRLTDEQITDMSEYVLIKADAGWPK